MVETTALSPHLGVALKWRGVLLTPHRTTVHGDEVILAVRGPGALLGELAAIDDEPRAASVYALEPIEVGVALGGPLQ